MEHKSSLTYPGIRIHLFAPWFDSLIKRAPAHWTHMKPVIWWRRSGRAQLFFLICYQKNIRIVNRASNHIEMPGRALTYWYADLSSGIHLFTFTIHTIKLQRWLGKDIFKTDLKLLKGLPLVSNSNVTSGCNRRNQSSQLVFQKKQCQFSTTPALLNRYGSHHPERQNSAYFCLRIHWCYQKQKASLSYCRSWRPKFILGLNQGMVSGSAATNCLSDLALPPTSLSVMSLGCL